MKKYILLVFILIAGAVSFVFFTVGVSTIHTTQETSEPVNHIHPEGEHHISLEQVPIRAFYFVPKDRTERIVPFWRDDIESALIKLQSFHALQFNNRSDISFTIHTEPVIGNREGIEYDTVDTSRGNPAALRSIALELEQRFPLEDEREIRVIVYEGVGASSSEYVAFLSHTFLSRAPYKQTYGPTFLAHEVYHMFGVHDHYDNVTGIAASNDIMGLGRFRNLEHTYIEYETLDSMGL